MGVWGELRGEQVCCLLLRKGYRVETYPIMFLGDSVQYVHTFMIHVNMHLHTCKHPHKPLIRTSTRSLRDHAAVQRCPARPDPQDTCSSPRDLKQDTAPRCWPSLSLVPLPLPGARQEAGLLLSRPGSISPALHFGSSSFSFATAHWP